ncbi:hypothetical protein DYI37_03950 [Fulvimarina endophytica]|uniref:Uncharacterized protein n=1 Tax=Fulvimarina endophytica TaxID=2293836 RepID=A0A371X741_9HYPH|nr:hypothetical protein [Fulvimarina endophytica]RFC65027.1 hypothetical protein DYI37_03950 [Fulvimarina endophytica]
MFRLLLGLELDHATIAAMAAVVLLFGLVAGHRVHFWLWYASPWVRRHVPADSGAWIGLIAGSAVLLL